VSAVQHESPPNDLSRDADDILLAVIARREDQTAAREAWAEFYRRHVRYVYAVCLRAYCRLLGGEAGVEALVSDTFLAVFQRGASTFRSSGSNDPEVMRKHVRAWLGQIARRLALLHLRRERARPEDLAGAVRWRSVLPRSEEPPGAAGEDVRRVRHAMETVLSERERDVLCTRMQFYDPEKAQQRLESQTLRDLANRWQTTPDNIRQVYHRAIAKIRQAVESGT
jgi:RNA polymerase sigma factor (sigma-70 family)